jgi:predicted  nucleic acid-binding Zn-ribbon protein
MPHKCYKCGTELQVKDPVQGLLTVICPTCGKENKIGMFPPKDLKNKVNL